MLWDVLGTCRLCAVDLRGHSTSVSRRVRSFFLQLVLELIMSTSALLGQISKLVGDDAENLRRSSVEAADEQLREIKRLCREQPKLFKRKGNEI